MNSSFIELGNLSMHVVSAGPTDGKPIVLLHGFPDAWFLYERQIKFLADRGYRVIVPDQRGYNKTGKPAGISSYRVDLLVEDILALLNHLKLDRVDLVGHDWGAAVAWMVALQHPERLRSLGIINVPHPLVFKKFIGTEPRQMMRSWYFGFFLIPFLPEFLLSLNNFAAMLAKKGSLNEEERRRAIEAWRQPGALTAMLNWYRAAILNRPELRGDGEIDLPVLILWGKRDPYLMHEMAAESLGFCPRGRLELLENAGHWAMLDESDLLNKLLLEFLMGDGADSDADFEEDLI